MIGGIEGGGIWDHAGLEGTPIVEDGLCMLQMVGDQFISLMH